jgi:hypothetical protein
LQNISIAWKNREFNENGAFYAISGAKIALPLAFAEEIC